MRFLIKRAILPALFMAAWASCKKEAPSPEQVLPRGASKGIESDPSTAVVNDPVWRALGFLTKHQSPDGSWGKKPETCSCRQFGNGDLLPGDLIRITGLAVLGFLMPGYSDLSKDEIEGIHTGQAIRRAAEWLEARLDPGRSPDDMPFVDRATGAFALSELYSMTGMKRWKPAAERAAVLAEGEKPQTEYGLIWKGMILKSVEVAGIRSSNSDQLKSMARELEKMPSVTSRAGALLLARWGGLSVENERVAKLLSEDAGGLPVPALYILDNCGYVAGDHKAWHSWLKQQQKRFSAIQDGATDSDERGSWPGTVTCNRIERASYMVLILSHYRCWTCRNVFRSEK